MINSSLVCGEPYADFCSCRLASLSENKTFYSQCFMEYVCAFNSITNEFCNGHGQCIFNESRCECDREYGLSDCSGKYEKYQVNDLIKYPLIILGAMFIIISLALIYWVWKYRTTGEVKAMSITFTNLMLLGCSFVSVGVMVIGIGWNQTNCILVEWFSFVGITLVISCAGIKAYRIASIFNRTMAGGVNLNDRTLLKYVIGATSVSVVLLIIYTALNFTRGGAYFRYLNGEEGPLLKEHRCSHEPATSVTYYVLVVYVLVLLISVLRYGNATQSASNIFKETRCIYLGSNIGTLIFIAFGVIILFTTNYSAQIAVRGFGTMIVVAVVIFLLFGPKMRAVYSTPKLDADGLTENERQLNVQYSMTLKERNGKELTLVMNTLVAELNWRLEYKIMKIELSAQHLESLIDLSQELKKLLETYSKVSPGTALKTVPSQSLASDKSVDSFKGTPAPEKEGNNDNNKITDNNKTTDNNNTTDSNKTTDNNTTTGDNNTTTGDNNNNGNTNDNNNNNDNNGKTNNDDKNDTTTTDHNTDTIPVSVNITTTNETDTTQHNTEIEMRKFMD